jgi:hypothetical protein
MAYVVQMVREKASKKRAAKTKQISRLAPALPKMPVTGTCFVIMPIGDQRLPDGRVVSEHELRERYDHVIRDAIRLAAPELNVTRADEVARPGSITADIYTRLMRSDFVVADISFSNANVFYELGIRHACRTGTILIKEETTDRAPFDVMASRHIPYQTSPGGWKKLSAKLKEQFEWLNSNTKELDNDFLAQAKFIGFQFPVFGQAAIEKQRAFAEAMGQMFAAPGVGELILQSMRGANLNSEQLMARVLESPQATTAILQLLISSGGKFEAPF